MSRDEEGPVTRGRASSRLASGLSVLAYIYLAFLFVWVLLRVFFHDRWAWEFLFNALSLYLFLPLLLILAINLRLRRHSIWIGCGLGLGLWLALFGGLLLPRLPDPGDGEETLTVMTFNVYGFNEDTDAIIEAIVDSRADVVGLQELNFEVANAIEKELATQFPYQVLEPSTAVGGKGVISRYPLSPMSTALGGRGWLGRPQLLTLDYHGGPVTLLHFHAIPVLTEEGLSSVEFSMRLREEQARAIVEFAAAEDNPLIALGDLNATDQNKAYDIISGSLTDSWRAAGWGFGHTFPGSVTTNNPHPGHFSIRVPLWLVRIDYIFHSEHWQTLGVKTGAWKGGSDHRPVIATLSLMDSDI